MILAVTALAASGGYYYYTQQGGSVPEAAAALKGKATSTTPAFTGGDQGFISLKLESVENTNHNTKKFRFALPESDQVSGLTIACKRN